MGKKARLKSIRRMVAGLPSISQHTCFKEVVKGEELIKDGIGIINEAPVNAQLEYIKRTAASIEINHARRAKKQYIKHGIVGVQGYLNSVNDFVAKQAVKEAAV